MWPRAEHKWGQVDSSHSSVFALKREYPLGDGGPGILNSSEPLHKDQLSVGTFLPLVDMAS